MNVIAQFFSLIALPFRLILAVPLQLIAAPKRLMGMSLPARIAVLIAVFLVLCTISAYTTFLLSHKRADYRLWLEPVRITIIVALVAAIPVIVYYVLRLWLEGHGSLFPDIDHAWRSGLAELAKQGIDLGETPLFLVLGCPDDTGAQALFQASGMSFRMVDYPPGAQALKWYADAGGIFIVCSDVGRLAGVLKNAAQRASGAGAAPVVAPRGGAALRGTIVIGGSDSPSEAPPSPAPAWGGSANLRGTLVIGNSEGGGGTSSSASIALAPAEADEQTARLEYFCQLLRRGREPFVPCNGILNLLPFDVIERGPGEALEIQRAVREDLAAFIRSAKVRCPVTALVARMDSEPGFRELVRRVGTDRAAAQRFGKGYSVWSPPVAEQLEAVAAHACGAFEDWVYSLFREADGFNKPGNTKLYQLLCKIRSHLAGRLKAILVNGFAPDSHHETTATTPLLFSGCYFAATGPAADRQAFVRSVLEKMLAEEGELEWTDEALDEDDRYQGLAKTALAISGMLSLAMIAMVVKKLYLK